LKQTEISVSGTREIYVVRQGWHTGFVVPSSTIQAQLPELYERFGNSPYLEFGWGDKRYYEADEITSGLTLQAIFWPTESVVHAVAIPERPDIHFTDSELETLCLDSRQYSLLIGFIENSFYKDNDGNIIKSKNDSDGNSQFYKGEGHYYSMNTCNNWTARGLKSAGLNISPTFKQTAGSIMGYLARHRDVHSACVSPVQILNHNALAGYGKPLLIPVLHHPAACPAGCFDSTQMYRCAPREFPARQNAREREPL
jgi:uncharacterized protein (TIGR02117 family)